MNATQRMDGLRRANEVRIAHAEWKTDLSQMTSADARNELLSLLEDAGLLAGDLGRMRLRYALMCIPHVAARRAGLIMRDVGLYGLDKKLTELTQTERGLLGVSIGRHIAVGQPA